MNGPHYATGEEPEWTHIYGSGADGDRKAYAIGFDDARNCFLSGVSNMYGMLFKVNANGTQANVTARETCEVQGGWT